MKLSNPQIYGLENSIRVAKFPKSVDLDKVDAEIKPFIGKLASAPTGSGHDNFLKGIVVQFDLTCSNKMWVEAERYHWFDIVSSQSTMHCISKFDIENQCNTFVDTRIIEIVNEKKDRYLKNKCIESYLELLYNIPSGFELTAGITTNYQQLKTIYFQRKNHRLPEWRKFCSWIESLPYMRDFLGLEDENAG